MQYKVLVSYKMLEIVSVEADSEEQAKSHAKMLVQGGGYDDNDNEIEGEREFINEIPSDDEIDAEILKN